jgi:hypothetical protein
MLPAGRRHKSKMKEQGKVTPAFHAHIVLLNGEKWEGALG